MRVNPYPDSPPPARPEEEAANPDTSIAKALRLLEALGTGRAAESLSSLAARTGMPKSTACRILRTMEQLGFVGRKESLYCLGPRLVDLGMVASVATHNDVRTASAGPLERLFEQVRTTVHLAVLSGTEVLYLEKISAPGGSRIPTRVGTTLPAVCTALGKVQLAFTPRRAVDTLLGQPLPVLTRNSVRSGDELLATLHSIRRSGFALDREEFRIGLSCVAAPVLVAGRAVAAISASSVNGSAFTSQRIRCVREAAQRVARNLALSRGPA